MIGNNYGGWYDQSAHDRSIMCFSLVGTKRVWPEGGATHSCMLYIMFVPRSVIRRPKQSQTNSKNAASKTLEQTSVVSHKSQGDPSLSTTSSSVDFSPTDSYTPQQSSPHQLQNESRAPLDQSVSDGHESDSDDSEGGSSDDEPVLSFSKQQRWPGPGEPVCVVCGRYGAYIVDRTDDDICSLECKAKRLMKLGVHVILDRKSGLADTRKEEEKEEGDGSWLYTEHPEVTAMTDGQCNDLYKRVNH